MSRRATFTYTKNLAIIGVQLTSSIIATNLTPALFVALMINQGSASISLTQDTGVLASHCAVLNSVAASSYYQPAEQNTYYMCPPGYGFFLQAGSPVSLYTSTDNAANSYISAIATIFTIETK